MIDRHMLEECILPSVSVSIANWILFTNRHHNEHRTPEHTIASFKAHTIGEYIDFNKLEALMNPQPKALTMPCTTHKIKVPEVKVIVELNHEQTTELFNLLEGCKNEHPELHELVYQAMTKELFNRINKG